MNKSMVLHMHTHISRRLLNWNFGNCKQTLRAKLTLARSASQRSKRKCPVAARVHRGNRSKHGQDHVVLCGTGDETSHRRFLSLQCLSNKLYLTVRALSNKLQVQYNCIASHSSEQNWPLLVHYTFGSSSSLIATSLGNQNA